MAELQPPVALQNVDTLNADDFRGFIQALLPTEGVIGSGDLAVTQNGTPNMSVNVAAGAAVIAGTDTPATQGSYFVKNDATKNLVVTAADPTNPRKDIVVAQVRDEFYIGGSDNDWRLAVIAGTPAASPSEPTLPDDCLKLAVITVAAGATSITSGAISDTRSFAGLFGTPAEEWTDYTPTLTQGGAVAKTVTYASYLKRGDLVFVEVLLAITGSGTANNQIELGLPPLAALHSSFINGTFRVYNASGPNTFIGAAAVWTSTSVVCLTHNNSNRLGQAGSSFSSALSSGDFVSLSFWYRTSS